MTTDAATTAKHDASFAPAETQSIDLRDPWLAAFLGWLLPGLGHMYQRRWGKGGLFMTCILATFIYGLWLGGGRVVYASFRDGDAHYAYLCQIGVGLPAMPAVVQYLRTTGPTPKAPMWDGLMAPPMLWGQPVPRDWAESMQAQHPDNIEFKSFGEYDPNNPGNDLNRVYARFVPSGERTDQLGYWQKERGSFWDLGTVFTMVAGLLNILAVWDAWGGPATTVVNAPPSSTDPKPKS